MKKLAIFILNLLVATQAHAFEDPNRNLDKVEQFLGPADFSSAFKENYNYDLATSSCVLAKCDVQEFHYAIKVISPDEVQVTTTFPKSQTPPTVSSVTAADWAAINGNPIRTYIATAENYGFKVTVTSSRESTAQLEINGRMTTVPTYELEILAKSTYEVIHTFAVAKDIPGAGLLVKHVQTNPFIAGTDTTVVTDFRHTTPRRVEVSENKALAPHIKKKWDPVMIFKRVRKFVPGFAVIIDYLKSIG